MVSQNLLNHLLKLPSFEACLAAEKTIRAGCEQLAAEQGARQGKARQGKASRGKRRRMHEKVITTISDAWESIQKESGCAIKSSRMSEKVFEKRADA